ncbi:MAG: hypothetical protein HPY69_16110, partial [Armatimonadetes bacterium]|nr:hypothetical protein [Armatimonadota bacterium]
MTGRLQIAGIVVLAVLACVVSAQAAQYYKFDGRWGSQGSGPLQFYYPTGIALDADGKVYVVEYYNHRVQRFASNMSYLSQWGGNGSSDGQFSYPWGIVISGEKKVYVSDTSGSNNNRIQIFQLTGFFLSKFGSYGSSTGQFNSPRGLAMDASNNIYVIEYGNHRLQKFNKNGGFITTWGGYGSGDTNFYYPQGVAFGAGNFVFVADTYNHRVVKYTSSGTYVKQWGGNGTSNGQFAYPAGIAVGPDNMVYVADTSNNRLQKFDADGNWKDTWGQYGSGDGQMYYPSGVFVDKSLKVWITEQYNHRIQRFRPNKPPTAPTKVTVKPLPAYDKTDVTANATGSTDVDGDALSYRYQWWKSNDGTTFTKGPTLKVLKNTETTVGQFWKVQAWAYDGIARSTKVYSEVFEIRGANTKPTAPTSVVITPKNPTDDDQLTATASGATDADGDTLTYRYQWQRSTDATSWTNGPAKKVLPATETSVGEWWRCQARAYDGTAVGPIKTSAKVQIGPGTGSALSLTATAQGGEVSQIVVSLSAAASVRATITNMAGIVVAELPARDLEAGISTLSWNGVGTSGSKVPGGVYLVRVTAA